MDLLFSWSSMTESRDLGVFCLFSEGDPLSVQGFPAGVAVAALGTSVFDFDQAVQVNFVGVQFGEVWVVFLDVGRVEESVGWSRDAEGCVVRGVGVCGLYVEAKFLILVVIELDVVGAETAG